MDGKRWSMLSISSPKTRAVGRKKQFESCARPQTVQTAKPHIPVSREWSYPSHPDGMLIYRSYSLHPHPPPLMANFLDFPNNSPVPVIPLCRKTHRESYVSHLQQFLVVWDATKVFETFCCHKELAPFPMATCRLTSFGGLSWLTVGIPFPLETRKLPEITPSFLWWKPRDRTFFASRSTDNRSKNSKLRPALI